MKLFDLTIIGGGPTGLYAAYFAGLRGLSTKIIDVLPNLGGQLMAFYPEKYVYDVPGFPKILAKKLASHLIEQALQYGPEICLGESIAGLQILAGDGKKQFKLTNGSAGEHFAKAILLTAGIDPLEPRKLNLPDAQRFENNGILYFVRNRSELRGKKLLVVGGGDSAVDWALNLEEEAKEVTLIHRRDEFRAHEHNVEKLLRGRARVRLSCELKAVLGNTHVEAAIVYNNQTMEEETLSVDYVLLSLGFIAKLGVLKNWGLETEKNDVRVTSRMETNIPGIYAAGDIAGYPAKLKLIATGFGEAAVAVTAVESYIASSA